MTELINNFIQKYKYWMEDYADPRTKDWFAVSNPFIILSITSAYLYFCKSLGPRLMEGRKPFELKTVIMLYNAFQVFFSMFLAREAYLFIFHKDFNLACEPVDYSDNPRALRAAAGTWYFYIAKITELLDTVFFILRKKFNQVTFLHVYHHTLMALIVWFGVKYWPGGHIILMGFLNCIVHVIMYTYYLISGLGPKYQKYLWWKKYVTRIQLIQFCIVFAHHFTAFVSNCDYPKIINILSCLNSAAFMYMFGKFYWDNYNKKPKNKTLLGTNKTSSLTAKVNKYDSRRKIAEKSR